jgi:hypothetical protein
VIVFLLGVVGIVLLQWVFLMWMMLRLRSISDYQELIQKRIDRVATMCPGIKTDVQAKRGDSSKYEYLCSREDLAEYCP